MKLNRKQLTLVGTTLYGDNWKTALASLLGVSERTIRRHSTSGMNLTNDQLSRIREVLRARVVAMDNLLFVLRNGEIEDD